MKNSFPSHYINPAEKGTDWIKQMVKAIWEEFDTQSIKSFSKGADRYNLNKLYSLGKQPNDIYKPMFELSEDDNSSFINLDLTPPAVLPKFRRLVNNKHSKVNFTINAQAIDEYALEDRLEYEAVEQANIKMRKMLAELGLPEDVLDSGEIDQPREEEELAIKMEFGYKHNMAIDVEKKVDAVFTESRIRDMLTVIRERLFDSGIAGFKAFTDKKTGRVGFRIVDPNNLVVSPTTDPFFRDIWYAGESILMTIEEIRREAKMCGHEFNEQELEEIAARHMGKFGNPGAYNTGSIGSYSYDSTKVPVFDGEFLSSNKYWYEKRIDKRGNPVIGKVKEPKNKEGREYMDDEDLVVFKFKWIIGTEMMFNYGLKSDIYRKADRAWDTHLSYILCAPELNAMETNPMIEQMIPIVDQVVLAWYKLQNVIAKARPKGILIEIGALEDISLGDGGKGEMTPLSILDMFTQTGVLVYRKLDAAGNPTNYRPVEELNNGLGNEAAEYFAVIDKYMSYLGSIIGMNEVTDGTTPDPRLLNGVAGMAQEATSNALHHLIIAERYLIEQLADEVAVRVHDSMVFKKDSVYRNIVAPSGIKSFKQNVGPLHRVYGIAVEYDADTQEKQLLQQKIQIAIERDQITLADSIAIERVRNLKQAELLLAYKIKKNMERKMKEEQARVQANADASAQAAQVAEQAKQQTLQLEGQVKGMLIDKEYQWKERIEMLKLGMLGEQQAQTNETKKEIEDKRSQTSKETAAIKKMGTAV